MHRFCPRCKLMASFVHNAMMASKTPRMPVNAPVAIIGMACRLPGASGLEELWGLLESRGTAWGRAPDARMDRGLYLDPGEQRPARAYTDLAGVMPERTSQRPCFPFQPGDEDEYDEAHLGFLQLVCQAFSHAGMDAANMSADLRTGVYVGHTGGSERIGDLVYASGIEEASWLIGETSLSSIAPQAVGSVAEELVARVRERYDALKVEQRTSLAARACAELVRNRLSLNGPAMILDAACASGLQALAFAVRAIRSGEIDQAVVGGVSHFKVDSLVLFSAAHSLSRNGSFPFCSAADGLVTSEGQVALILKPLSAALRDGDPVQAVIEGVGISSDGRGKSLWAPRGEGQLLAMQRAYPDPSVISGLGYIEAHATGTQLGDATEMTALAEFLGGHLPAGERVLVGSIKTNIGHTLETAGLASIVKVVLAMQRGVIPAGVAPLEKNPILDELEVIALAEQTQPWPERGAPGLRRAAVNAFGIGGINAHVVLSSGANHHPSHRPPVPEDATVYIRAMDCVLPGADSREAFLAQVGAGRTAISRAPANRWDATRLYKPDGYQPFRSMLDRGGFIADWVFDWRSMRIPPRQVESANPLQFMILDAVERATKAAGPSAAATTAVLVGTSFGGDFSNQLQMGLRLPESVSILRQSLAGHGLSPKATDTIINEYEQALLRRYPALLDETGSFTASSLATRVIKAWDLMGGAVAIDAGLHTTAAVLLAARDLLQSRECNRVICAFATRQMDLFSYQHLSVEMTRWRLQNPGSGTPEDAWIPGEGVVVMVLERQSTAASERGAPKLAQIEIGCDAQATPLSPPTPAQPLIGCLGAVDDAVAVLQLDKPGRHVVGRQVARDFSRITIERPEPQARKAPPPRGKVAALFPGQGSQYEDLFRELCDASPLASLCKADLDELARCIGYPTLDEVAWHPDHRLGTCVWDTQWAVFLGDLLAWRILAGCGVEVDLVAAHSFGEYPMLVASGAIDFRTCAEAAHARADALEAHAEAAGGLVSLHASGAEAADLIAALSEHPKVSTAGGLWLSAHNAPRQTVIGGASAALDALEDLCEERRIACKRLAVSCAYHTPLLAAAAGTLGPTLNGLDAKTPRLPVMSATLARQVSTAADIRRSLVEQLTSPVLWVETLQALYTEGVRTFIEVGPASVLTGLVRQTLGHDPEVRVLSMDGRVRAGEDPLAALLQRLAGAGLRTANAPPSSSIGKPREILRFDATASRRERNRASATAARDASGGSGPATHEAASAGIDSAPLRAHLHHENSQRADQGRSDRQKAVLHREIIDFVIEQTGYPEDMVDFAADLEADLGIDSIRKAQLLAELGHRHGLARERGISLTDFVSLQDVENYFLSRLAKHTTPPVGARAEPPTSRPAPLAADILVVSSGATTSVLLTLDRFAPVEMERRVHGEQVSWLVVERDSRRPIFGWNESGSMVADAASLGQNLSVADRLAASGLTLIAGTAADIPDLLQQTAGDPADIWDSAPALADGGGLVYAQMRAGREQGTWRSWPDSGPQTILMRFAEEECQGDWTETLPRVLADAQHEFAAQLSSAGKWLLVGTSGDTTEVRSGGGPDASWSQGIANSVNWASRPEYRQPIAERFLPALIPVEASGGRTSLSGRRVSLLGKHRVADHLIRVLDAAGAAAQHFDSVAGWSAHGAPGEMLILAEECLLDPAGTIVWPASKATLPGSLYVGLQRWLYDAPSEPRRLLALVHLGGDAGLSGQPASPMAEAVLGLLAGLGQEFPSLWARVVDVGEHALDAALGDGVVAELCDVSRHARVALSSTGRHIVGMSRKTAPESPGSVPRSGDVWLVTGGAAGITAECALELGRRYGLKLAIVGRTPLNGAHGANEAPTPKQLAIGSAMHRFQASGVEAEYFDCDLTSFEQTRDLVTRLIARFGAIHGLLHGAGIESSARFAKKTLAGLEATVAAKALALEHLIEALHAEDSLGTLTHVVGFGSTSGHFGGHGQADYSLANQMLARRVARLGRAQPSLRACCFHWHAWDEVGMASRASSRFVLEQAGIRLMPVREGVSHFMAEIEAGLPSFEVVISEAALVHANAHRFPLTDAASPEVPKSLEATSVGDLRVRLDADGDTFLSQHRFRGVPLLPAVISIELMLQAACSSAISGDLALRVFKIRKPFELSPGSKGELQLRVITRDNGDSEVRLLNVAERSRVMSVGRVGCYSGRITAIDHQPCPFPLHGVAYAEDSIVRHGPAFQTLRQVCYERNGGWAILEAPEPLQVLSPLRVPRALTPAALLDGCFYACGMFAFYLCGQREELPLALDGLRAFKVPTAGTACMMRFRLRQQTRTHSIHDFAVFDSAGSILLEVRGLKMGLSG